MLTLANDLTMNELEMTISYENNQEMHDAVKSRFRTHHFMTMPEQYTPDGSPIAHTTFDIYIKDENENIIGGLLAEVFWEAMHINFLWVDAAYRDQGMGTRLMRRAEEEALEQGCRFIWLTSYSYDAPGFYRHLGFRVTGRLDDFPPGYSLYTMRKDIR